MARRHLAPAASSRSLGGRLIQILAHPYMTCAILTAVYLGTALIVSVAGRAYFNAIDRRDATRVLSAHTAGLHSGGVAASDNTIP